jgi:hypothetical protein
MQRVSLALGVMQEDSSVTRSRYPIQAIVTVQPDAPHRKIGLHRQINRLPGSL